MQGEIRQKALRLLRAVNERQAEGRVGAAVLPANAAPHAGLVPNSGEYDTALSYLVDEGALVADEAPADVEGHAPPGSIRFKLTRTGVDMLRG